MTQSIVALLLTTILVGCGGPDITITGLPEGTDDMGAMKDGWSVSGYLSTGGQLLPANNAHAATMPEISTQARFSEVDHGPGAQYFTVQFNVTPPAHGLFYAYADVTWSVQGNDTTRRISIANGTVISGTAQYVKVRMFDGTPAALVDSRALTSEAYYVDACITPGSRPSTQQPPRFVPPVFPGQAIIPGAAAVPGFYDIAASLSLDVPIDQTAGIISVFIQGIGANRQLVAGDATIFFSVSGLGVSNVDMKDIIGEWLPVPPGANALGIQNNSNTDPLFASVVFGVEG